MVDATIKKTMLTVLVAAFVVQTALVYSDERQEPLSADALSGRELWHANACQVCHQVYGQGGFLGPDLTNASSYLDNARLDLLLKEGSGQMPAFDFSETEIQDMRAFLKSMDRPELGRGQLRMARATSSATPWDRFGAAVTPLLTGAPDAQRGWNAMQVRICTACHLPLAASPTGAPDLSLVMERLSAEELRTVLAEGRVANGMPAPTPAFSDEELDAVLTFMNWLGENRAAVASGMEAGEPDRSI
ncbi:MAG: cytochrome c, partial [Gemmatimonadetes bacterium]|nr:cytochrome c [Gemmatimonadota bacterium]